MTTATANTNGLKDDVVALSKILKAGITIAQEPNDPSRGLAVINEGANIYVDNLPEGLTVETVKQLQNYNSLFVAASTNAFGEDGIDFLKKNKGVERVTLSIPTVGKDTLDYDLKRSSSHPNPSSPGETIVKYAPITVTHNEHGTRAVGDLKKVKIHLAELGAKALAGK